MSKITFYDDIKRTSISEDSPKYTDIHTQILKSKVSGGETMDYINRGELNQFDKRMTDKLNDIKIDTDKIKTIDNKLHGINQDVSTIKTDLSNMEKSFDTSLSSIQSSVKSIDDNMSIILDAKFDSMEGKIDSKISHVQWTTGWAALSIIVAIFIAGYLF